jgi:CheY-like chemotaxis protein
MPEMDGFQFLDQYTKFSADAKKNSTIYMLTSSNNPEDVKKAGDYLYIKNFFNKPLSSELVAQI